jgi:hypothetical protein
VSVFGREVTKTISLEYHNKNEIELIDQFNEIALNYNKFQNLENFRFFLHKFS